MQRRVASWRRSDREKNPAVASAYCSAERDDCRVTISAFGLTDVGKKRRHNEDAYLLDVERGLSVVADGMRGHAAGEVASRITVQSIHDFTAGTEPEHENTWPIGLNNRYPLEANRPTTALGQAPAQV